MYLHKKSFILCLLIITNLLILALSDDTFKAHKEEEIDKRFTFYQSLANHYRLEERIKIEKDDFDVKIRIRQEINAGGPILGVDRKFFFSSCNFFPFKTEIYHALLTISQNSNMPPEELIPLYGLIYNILYFKIGDFNKGREYYEKISPNSTLNIDNESWKRFYSDTDMFQYLNIFPKYIIKNVLSYQDEEVNLINNLKLDSSFLRNSEYIFNYMNHYFINNNKELYVRIF